MLKPEARLLIDTLKQGARSATIHQYQPHGKQVEFHKAQTMGRIFQGGNRSGKTVGGGAETVYYLRNNHPYKKLPWGDVQIRGRGVAVDIEDGLKKIMLPEIAKWIPPSLLINGSWEQSYSKQERMLTCSNGNQMDFLTNEQDAEKHAGTSRHFVWFDEEPPKHIYNENMMRLVDTGGHWWMTMTPLLGLTWLYEEYYKPIFMDGVANPNVTIIMVDSMDNPHINEAALDVLTSGLSEEEKTARRHGLFMAFSGLIYNNFDEELHVVPSERPNKNDLVFVGMDWGFRNPSAWLWCSVNEDGILTVFHCHYQSEWTADQHADYVHNYNALNKISPEYYVGDPAIVQRKNDNYSTHALFAECGIPILLGNNDVRTGIDRVRWYFDKKFIRITEDCDDLIKELRSYRWAPPAKKSTQDPREAVNKYKDHAVDALRYLIMTRPEDDRGSGSEPINVRDILGYSTTPPDDNYSYDDLEDNTPSGHWILGDEW